MTSSSKRNSGTSIGLYLDPPEKALILCCDEKSQCQALERTQPGLPLGVGHIRTATHDYIRHGTITLFAALNYLEGKIISRTEAKHTHVEWLRFLKQIDRETPKDLEIHMIAGQLRHSQTRQRPRVDAASPAFSHAFYPHVEFLVEPGGAVLRRPHTRCRARRKLPQCPALGPGHRVLSC